MSMELQTLREVALCHMIAGLVEVDMRVRGLKRSHSDGGRQEDGADSAHRFNSTKCPVGKQII